MYGARSELRERSSIRQRDYQMRREREAGNREEFDLEDTHKLSKTNHQTKPHMDCRDEPRSRSHARKSTNIEGPAEDNTHKKTPTGQKYYQELSHVEESYRNLLEKKLPEYFGCLLQHPILFTEAVTATFVIINDFLDERIRTVLSKLGVVLGIPEDKKVLLEIILNYPNNLCQLEPSEADQLAYSVREELNNISLKRTFHYNQTKL